MEHIFFFANVYVLQLIQSRLLSKTLIQNNKDIMKYNKLRSTILLSCHYEAFMHCYFHGS